MHDAKDELDPPFEILEPGEWRGPAVFNSPHSGSVYPLAFLNASRLDIATLRRSEDSFVDELVRGVVAQGYPLMRAHFPRCYVDVNREPYELDPRMFEGRLPSFANTRSMRVAGGLGTVARVVGDAQEIYGQRLPVDDAIRRIETLYKPYHRSLRRLFTRVHRDFGAAVLVVVKDRHTAAVLDPVGVVDVGNVGERAVAVVAEQAIAFVPVQAVAAQIEELAFG